jgi:uncharacterized protein (DUF58 family)
MQVPFLTSLISALTLRGRAFVVGGLSALLAGTLLGQQSLSYVGLLTLSLAVFTLWLMHQAHFRIGLHRHLDPDLLAVGEQTTVTLRLSKHSISNYGTLLLEEQLPYALGSRPHFALAAFGSARPVQYVVRADTRGRYVLGPLHVRLKDPFGLVESTRAFSGTNTLLVTPATARLTGQPSLLLADSRGGDQSHSFAAGNPEDVTVREYRRGDELRRIHWPSSAKTGDLMVRNEEAPWQAEATVLLDNRTRSHRLSGDLELAISVAASVCSHLVTGGYAVSLAWAASGEVALAETPEDIAEALASVRASDNNLPPIPAELPTGGLVIAALGQLIEGDLARWRSLCQRGRANIALLNHNNSQDALTLRESGWRCATATSLRGLNLAWQTCLKGPSW